jgi:hypothetical protein
MADYSGRSRCQRAGRKCPKDEPPIHVRSVNPALLKERIPSGTGSRHSCPTVAAISPKPLREMAANLCLVTAAMDESQLALTSAQL